MIKIITDSTCDLPDELLKKYDITVVPLYLRFGMKTFKENVEISREEFYNKLALEKELPTTSQPSPGDFLKVYENIINKGDVIISLHISGKLSGTVNSAQNARIMILDENKSADITVIDSQSAGPGLGLIVVKAAQMAKEGFEKKLIIEKLNSISCLNHGIFLVNKLDHLYRGGRITKTQAFMGNLLHMYPLVELKEGSIDLFGKALGLKNAIDKMLDYFYEKTKKSKPQAISVISATLKKEQDDIFNKLKEEFPDLYIVKSVFGSVIGAHIGKECLAILWF